VEVRSSISLAMEIRANSILNSPAVRASWPATISRSIDSPPCEYAVRLSPPESWEFQEDAGAVSFCIIIANFQSRDKCLAWSSLSNFLAFGNNVQSFLQKKHIRAGWPEQNLLKCFNL
jgi:hypothetical protein